MATYTFKVRGEGLPIKDFTSSDPYLVIRVPDVIQGDHLTAHCEKFNSEAADIGFELGGAAAEAGVAAMGIIAVTGAAGATCAGVAAASIIAPVAISIAVPLAVTQLVRVATKLHKTKKGYTEIYSSEPVKHNLNPTWPPFQLRFEESYHNSPYAKLLIEMWDWDRFSPSDFMGSCELYVKDIVHQKGDKRYQMLDKKGRPQAGVMYISASHDGKPAGGETRIAGAADELRKSKEEEEKNKQQQQQQHEQQQHEHRPSSFDQQAHAHQYPQQYVSNYDSYYGQHQQHQQYGQSYNNNYYPSQAPVAHNHSYYDSNHSYYNSGHSSDNAYQSNAYNNGHPQAPYNGYPNNQYGQHSAQYPYGYTQQPYQ